MAISRCGRFIIACGLAAIPLGWAQAGPFHMLYSFLDGSDGASPDGPLISDGQGNLYGTALQGGASLNTVPLPAPASVVVP